MFILCKARSTFEYVILGAHSQSWLDCEARIDFPLPFLGLVVIWHFLGFEEFVDWKKP